MKAAGKFFTWIIMAVMFISLTACKESDDTTLESLYSANSISAILENHVSVRDEFSYYENLDKEETFRTTYCYYQDDMEDPVYIAESADTLNKTSDNNFKYCIINGMEYYFGNNQTPVLYPLTSDYNKYTVNSLNTHDLNLETRESADKDGDNLILITSANPEDIYTDDRLAHIESLCGDTVIKIKYEYTADSETKLLKSIKTFFITKNKSEYLFSEEKLSYDVEKPSVKFAEAFINPSISRNLTIVEKTKTGDIVNTYTIPAACTVNLKCFTELYDYQIFNDTNKLDPFTEEIPNDGGYYENITLYAFPDKTQED